MADQFTWTAADGSVITLSDPVAGYLVVAEGTAGLRSPEYDFASLTYAGVDGDDVQAIRAVAATPTLGLEVAARDEREFRAKARGLVHAMRPKAGPGQLTVTTGWGDSRSLTCYCKSGLPGDESPKSMNPRRRWRMALTFYAPDPWWYGAEQIVSLGLGAGGPFFPIPPVSLAPSTVQGQFTIDLSDSDAATYPVWTITGPGSGLVLSNLSTGRSITLTVDLAEGQSLIVDTRRGFQSVRLDDGTNLAGVVQGDPALWPLVDGVNVVSAAMTGASSASRIVGSYRARYSGI